MIAWYEQLPVAILEKDAKREGLLESRRGSSGGYRLSRPTDQVTVGAVLRAVEGSGAEPARRAGRQARGDHEADLSELWREITLAVSAVVDRVTLEDLRRRAEERRSSGRPMYHI